MTGKNSYTIAILTVLLGTILSQYCNEFNEKLLKYKLVKTNSYSKKTVLSRKQVDSLEKCKEFAAEKRALAFNFGLHDSIGEADRVSDDPFDVNCIILLCPEINNFTALVYVKGFSYYSVYYRKIWLGENRTISCIPTAGLFVISNDFLNYTDAQKSCENLNASLAHVVSESRTNQLAAMMGNHSSVYVGLSSEKQERTWKNECGEPLSCFYYRAWGERQPSRTYGCVALTLLDVNSIPFWETIPCKRQLQYICEIAPVYYQRNSTNNTDLPNCGMQTRGQLWEMLVNKRVNNSQI